MFHFRQAVQEDMDGVLALYDQVIERFQAQTGTMAWRKGVYPTRANFQQAIQAGALYLGELEGALAAGMIITQGTDKTYGTPPWRVDAPDEKTAVIHTLGVSPAFSGRGLALKMIEGAAAPGPGEGLEGPAAGRAGGQRPRPAPLPARGLCVHRDETNLVREHRPGQLPAVRIRGISRNVLPGRGSAPACP